MQAKRQQDQQASRRSARHGKRQLGRPRSYDFPSLAVGGYVEYEGDRDYLRAARASILKTALREGLTYRTAIKRGVLKVWRPE